MTIFNTRLLISLMGAVLLTACTQNPAQSANPATEKTAEKSKQNSANGTVSDTAVVQALQEKLNKADVNITVNSAIATAMPDVYWVNFDNAPAMFTDKTGSYLIQGQIVKLGDNDIKDIGADIAASLAKDELAKVPSSEMIIYPAEGEKQAAVYVFSDPTCSYCQLLHKELEQINAGGVEVRYLAWPRADKDTALVRSIWCSPDPKAAITTAKNGAAVKPASCDDPVARHKALGLKLGVTGTPAIFTESGTQIGGYLPANELIKLAKQSR